jgi:uncharacterized membrane protein (DUF4010 family)
MSMTLSEWLPPQAQDIFLVLFLSFLIGLEREEKKAAAEKFMFGGVRTFPLIGLVGYAMASLSGSQIVPLALGFFAVAGFLLLSYWHKLVTGGLAGLTSEFAGLITYLIGALVFQQHLWLATTLGVVSMLLLELKGGLEGLARRIAPEDVVTFTKFLMLTAVILPILPNEAFSQFQINPFKSWLVVVAVSAVSYGSYVIQKLSKGQGGVILAAILGGAYSSTLTSVVLAKRSATESLPHLFSGAILMASGVMYLRLAVLLALFNWELMRALSPSFLVLGVFAMGVGWVWSRRRDAGSHEVAAPAEPRNPLELRAALAFALLFLVMLVATQLATVYLGHAGVYTLSAMMGVADVDPFIMGMTQASGTVTPPAVAAIGILVAAASNNVAKGAYAYFLSSGAAGIQSAGLLIGLSMLGLMPLLWLA